jgi:hypothetical protein
MAAAHKDKDGVQMLFSSKSGGKEYYLSDAREKDRRRTQDQNNAEKKTEGAPRPTCAPRIHPGDF